MIVTARHTLSIVSDLKDFGNYGEDGSNFIGEVFYIQLETPNGDRYRHRRSFDGVVFKQDELGNNWPVDRRSEVNAYLKGQIRKMHQKHEVNLQHWYIDRPAYGSRAYQQYGQYEDFGDEQT